MSDGIEISQVLAQMKVMQAKAGGLERPVADVNNSQVDFSSMLKESLDKVNGVQKTAGKMATAFDAGDPNVNLSEVMISLQKSSVAFQSVLQVRNKLVEAYNEVKNIRV
jgi:flagellar hook-basal body complex protein FliE